MFSYKFFLYWSVCPLDLYVLTLSSPTRLTSDLAQQHRRQERALAGRADRAVGAHDLGGLGRAQQQLAAGVAQHLDLTQHLVALCAGDHGAQDRKSTRLNYSH